MTRAEEINEEVTKEMKRLQIEDTVENRIEFLKGLRDAWLEDSDDSFEKSLYQLALGGEIFKQELRQLFPKLV